MPTIVTLWILGAACWAAADISWHWIIAGLYLFNALLNLWLYSNRRS